MYEFMYIWIHLWNDHLNSGTYELAKLHVCVLRSFVIFNKLIQNLMELLQNHIMVW